MNLSINLKNSIIFLIRFFDNKFVLIKHMLISALNDNKTNNDKSNERIWCFTRRYIYIKIKIKCFIIYYDDKNQIISQIIRISHQWS